MDGRNKGNTLIGSKIVASIANVKPANVECPTVVVKEVVECNHPL